MGYRVKPFTMAVRDNSTQQFIDVGLLGSDVDADVEELQYKTEWIVTPEMFGAVGDGITDDTEAFQDAINECQNNGTVFLIPARQYLISSTLNILNASIHIVGEHKFSTDPSTAPSWNWNILYSGSDDLFNIGREACGSIFENLYIESTTGDDSTSSEQNGVGVCFHLNSAVRCVIRDNKIRHFQNAVLIEDAIGAWAGENIIRSNTFDEDSIGIEIIYSNGYAPTDNYFDDNICIHNYYFIKAAFIDGSFIKGNHDYSYNGIYCDRIRSSLISNNYFDNGFRTSLYLSVDNNINISNNLFLCGGSAPSEAVYKIYVRKHGYTQKPQATIIGNIITSSDDIYTNLYVCRSDQVYIKYVGNMTKATDFYQTSYVYILDGYDLNSTAGLTINSAFTTYGSQTITVQNHTAFVHLYLRNAGSSDIASGTLVTTLPKYYNSDFVSKTAHFLAKNGGYIGFNIATDGKVTLLNAFGTGDIVCADFPVLINVNANKA